MALTARHEETIERGSRARAARIETEHFAHAHEQLIIQQLVSRYRQGALTFEYCIGKVGEIVAIRDLISQLGGYETQGHVAKEKANGS